MSESTTAIMGSRGSIRTRGVRVPILDAEGQGDKGTNSKPEAGAGRIAG